MSKRGFDIRGEMWYYINKGISGRRHPYLWHSQRESLFAPMLSLTDRMPSANVEFAPLSQIQELDSWRMINIRASPKRRHPYIWHPQREFRLRRRYPRPAPDKRACRSSGGVCELVSSALPRKVSSFCWECQRKKHAFQRAWHSQRESNSQLTLRRGLLYPFNYGSNFGCGNHYNILMVVFQVYFV